CPSFFTLLSHHLALHSFPTRRSSDLQDIRHVQIWVFGFAVIFTLIANTWYIFINQKGKLLKAGGAITHFGFGLMLLGILFSGYRSEEQRLNSSHVKISYAVFCLKKKR